MTPFEQVDTHPVCDSPPSGRASLLIALVRGMFWFLSAVLLVFATICFAGRFDACAAVTLYPLWCWAAVGLLLTALGFSRRHWLVSASLAVLWLIFLASFADTPVSLVRILLLEPARGTNLRVVTLNCSSFAFAARAALAQEPDVVLLQESPMRDDLVALAHERFGPGQHVHWGVDASIVARGNVTPIAIPAQFRDNFLHARVDLDGRSLDVISLRLYPCPIRLDLWSRECWQYYQKNRAIRRRQMERIVAYLETLPPDTPIILGGDFNCPPGDAVLHLLEPRLADAFATAGRGWGATIIDLFGWPLIRIDQIWTSQQLAAQNAFARPARPSDHCMAVADFALGN